MHDLAGAYQRLNTVYRQYIESAFPLRYRNMAEERRALLDGADIIAQPPLLEPAPVYPTSGWNLAQAGAQLPPEYRDLPSLAQALLRPEVRLYRHQWHSLQAVIQEGRDLVVTTGTGSGKTECFLLPLLAELARESADWPACPPPPPGRRWWESPDAARVGQWAHTGRHAQGRHALRGMILYPLNSLVEDQLLRLRRTLDSPPVHQWLDAHRGGNRITFGRYTGAAPVSGRPDDDRAGARLRERLHDLERESREVRASRPADDELRYYFPDLDGGEMWSRWDMQETPPDLLITNYSMLNIMLMRQLEAGMFAQTREWLKASPAHKFFLIVDELHSYRGTPGTEVAYILRLLLQRLGAGGGFPATGPDGDFRQRYGHGRIPQVPAGILRARPVPHHFGKPGTPARRRPRVPASPPGGLCAVRPGRSAQPAAAAAAARTRRPRHPAGHAGTGRRPGPSGLPQRTNRTTSWPRRWWRRASTPTPPSVPPAWRR